MLEAALMLVDAYFRDGESLRRSIPSPLREQCGRRDPPHLRMPVIKRPSERPHIAVVATSTRTKDPIHRTNPWALLIAGMRVADITNIAIPNRAGGVRQSAPPKPSERGLPTDRQCCRSPSLALLPRRVSGRLVAIRRKRDREYRAAAAPVVGQVALVLADDAV